MTVETCYDDLTEHYHLIFEDWDRSIQQQASILGPLLERYAGHAVLSILDCACGIGTQALGLAQLGHKIVASDLSRSSVARAQREARRLGVEIRFHVAGRILPVNPAHASAEPLERARRSTLTYSLPDAANCFRVISV